MILLIQNTLILWLATNNVSSFSVNRPLGRRLAYSHHSLDRLAVSLSESNEVENIAEELSNDSPVDDIEESEQKEPEATDDAESTIESGSSDEETQKSTNTNTERHTVYVGNLPYSKHTNHFIFHYYLQEKLFLTKCGYCIMYDV